MLSPCGELSFHLLEFLLGECFLIHVAYTYEYINKTHARREREREREGERDRDLYTARETNEGHSIGQEFKAKVLKLCRWVVFRVPGLSRGGGIVRGALLEGKLSLSGISQARTWLISLRTCQQRSDLVLLFAFLFIIIIIIMLSLLGLF